MKQTNQINLDAVRSEKYDDNIDRYGDNSNTCFLCGKRTAEKLFVHYTNMGELVNERDELMVPESQGFFPIGSECAKKLPKSFVFNL